ncbi:M48 family metallopeptidase [Desulfococcus sp.]|uniref:M48 family metallopeptidase n=1 Tax=Desulfococcus sp. TaxID=2025834 RepID=UPI003593B489
MNVVAVIILVTLAANWALDLAAGILNVRNLRSELPAGFEDVYDPDRYRRSQAYLRANTRLGWVSGTVTLAALLAFWFGGGFSRVDVWVRSFGWGTVPTGLAFVAVLVMIRFLLGLPFSIYAVFVIEERFGFNRTGWKTFAADRVKAGLLGAAVGGPLLAGILIFFERAAGDAWWICWIAVTLFSLALQYVAPAYIMPLFNKFTPLEDGPLKTAILDYTRAVDYPVANLAVMDGSKRSGKGNAFFAGFGRHKRIALFDTLIRQHTVEELVAVLAHEIGHYKKRHVLQGMLIGIGHAGVMFYLLSRFISYPGLFEAFYMSEVSVYGGMIFFAMLFSPVDFFLGLLLQMRSRRNEFAADRFAAETTGRPEAMISALKKLSANNLGNLLPHPFHVFLHYSHPPVTVRVAALKGLPPGV